MDEIKDNILTVYNSKDNNTGDNDMIYKNAIQVLHEIELNINNNINTIKYIL